MSGLITCLRLMCIIVLTSFAWVQATYAGNTLTVRAVQILKNERPAIRFSVENKSKFPVQMYSADLPWANIRSIVIVAITKNGSEILQPSGLIDDAGPGTTAINIGEKLQGAIFLDHFVNGLEAVRKKHDILVFWFYEPKSEQGKALGEFGGWLIFPKSR